MHARVCRSHWAPFPRIMLKREQDMEICESQECEALYAIARQRAYRKVERGFGFERVVYRYFIFCTHYLPYLLIMGPISPNKPTRGAVALTGRLGIYLLPRVDGFHLF